MKYFIIVLTFLSLLSCSTKNHRVVSRTDKAISTDQNKELINKNIHTNIGSETRSNVSVKYFNDSIIVRLTKGKDMSIVSIPFKTDPDKMMGCDSCLFINNNGNYSMVSNYQINDSLFLLPVLDFNRLLLFGINFRSQKVLVNEKLGDTYLSTSLEAIIYNVKNSQVVIANSLELNEENEVQNVTSHFFEVGGAKFLFRKTITVDVPKDLKSEVSSMRLTLEKLSKM